MLLAGLSSLFRELAIGRELWRTVEFGSNFCVLAAKSCGRKS